MSSSLTKQRGRRRRRRQLTLASSNNHCKSHHHNKSMRQPTISILNFVNSSLTLHSYSSNLLSSNNSDSASYFGASFSRSEYDRKYSIYSIGDANQYFDNEEKETEEEEDSQRIRFDNSAMIVQMDWQPKQILKLFQIVFNTLRNRTIEIDSIWKIINNNRNNNRITRLLLQCHHRCCNVFELPLMLLSLLDISEIAKFNNNNNYNSFERCCYCKIGDNLECCHCSLLKKILLQFNSTCNVQCMASLLKQQQQQHFCITETIVIKHIKYKRIILKNCSIIGQHSNTTTQSVIEITPIVKKNENLKSCRYCCYWWLLDSCFSCIIFNKQYKESTNKEEDNVCKLLQSDAVLAVSVCCLVSNFHYCQKCLQQITTVLLDFAYLLVYYYRYYDLHNSMHISQMRLFLLLLSQPAMSMSLLPNLLLLSKLFSMFGLISAYRTHSCCAYRMCSTQTCIPGSDGLHLSNSNDNNNNNSISCCYLKLATINLPSTIAIIQTTTKSPSTISSSHLPTEHFPHHRKSLLLLSTISTECWDKFPYQLTELASTIPSLCNYVQQPNSSQIESISTLIDNRLTTISTYHCLSSLNVDQAFDLLCHIQHIQQTRIAQFSSSSSLSLLPCFPFSSCFLYFPTLPNDYCNPTNNKNKNAHYSDNSNSVKQAEQNQLLQPLLLSSIALSQDQCSNTDTVNNNNNKPDNFKHLTSDLSRSASIPSLMFFLFSLCLSIPSASRFAFTLFASAPSTFHQRKHANLVHSSLSSHFRTLFCLILTLLTVLSSSGRHQVLADRNRFYHISALCLREQVHPLNKKIDGAVITSKSENNLDCTITFQTDTILQKFMLRFEKLALDCNDHLYIYDGAHTIGNHKADLSCRSTRAEVGTIYTQSNFLTLRYTTDAYSIADNGFKLIITAYKESKNYCREHRCSNQFCISRDLVCDGVNHCNDNSDESYYANCQAEYEETETIIGLDPLLFVAIVSSVFVSCLVCVISVSVCLCRRERLLQRQQQRIALQQQYQGHQLLETHQGTTPILGHNNNSYTSKLDGACTMITSLDGYGATRNGGIVNSFTHTALPNHNNSNNFATMPHLHNHNHHIGGANNVQATVAQLAAGVGLQMQQQLQQQQNHIQQQQQQQASHVRFGTLPVRGNEKPPPPYPGGNNFANNHNHGLLNSQQNNQNNNNSVNSNGSIGNHIGNHFAPNLMNNNAANLSNGNGINLGMASAGAGATPPHSSQQSSVVKPVQTQVIYTAK